MKPIKQSPGKQIKTGLITLPIAFIAWIIVNFIGLGKGEADRNFNSTLFGRFLSVLVVALYVLEVLAIILVLVGIIRLIVSRFAKPTFGSNGSTDQSDITGTAQTASIEPPQNNPTDKQQ